MVFKIAFEVLIVLAVSCLQPLPVRGQNLSPRPNKELITNIRSTYGLIALWKFNEPPGKARKSMGKGRFPLKEGNGEIQRINEGPVSGYSLILDGSNFLSLPHSSAGKLNIQGRENEVTVIAWVKWTGEQTGFVGGMGNNGSDFTVGAVLLKSGMGNFYKGFIGGLAIFNRTLDEDEIKHLVQ